MNGAELRRSLRAGIPVHGTLVVSPSPRWPSAIAGLGLDFVFIDTEHIALDRAPLSWMCQTYAALGMAPLVRIPAPDPYAACMALDGGAAGVVAPYIETIAQVQALRGVLRLRPLKGQRLVEALADEGSIEPKLAAYLQERNRDSVLVINIESVPAMDRLDDLLAVPGLDAVLIGPHDLSCSLGLPECYDDPRFEAAVISIITRARARGVGAGIHWWGDPRRLLRWKEVGLNLIILSGDITAMRDRLASDLRAIRGELSAAQGRPAPI